MRYLLLLITLFGSFTTLWGQQLPIYSQYFWNEYTYNPAATASRKDGAIQVSYRDQWVDFKGAPKTYSVGAYGFLKKQKIGIGGMVFSDETGGAFAQTGAILNANYMLELNRKSELFMGLGAVLNQYAFDGTAIATTVADPQLNYAQQQTVSDFNAGVLYQYNNALRIGFAVNQLVQSRLTTFDAASGTATNRLVRHVNFNAAYRVALPEHAAIEPYVQVRSILVTPPQVQTGFRWINKNDFYVGLSYRSSDAISFMLGYAAKKLLFGYAYDATTSRLKHVSSGSHELILGYRFLSQQSGTRYGR